LHFVSDARNQSKTASDDKDDVEAEETVKVNYVRACCFITSLVTKCNQVNQCMRS